jgi:IS30 family transposase
MTAPIKPKQAHSHAATRRRRCRRRTHISAEDMARVTVLLRRRWSAEQISAVFLMKTDQRW